MADAVTSIAKRLRRRPDPTSPAGQRWEIADLLARVDAELARRAA